MSEFEILCVTMNQRDFSKLDEMNIHSDAVFANQADRVCSETRQIDGHTVKMITTDTVGVGKNRNIALLYATGDICLFADDDIKYFDDTEERIVSEFSAHRDADIIIFNVESTSAERKQITIKKTHKIGRLSRLPYGCVRVAFRLSSVRKANLWFTTMFGGGCIFASGEDSMWLTEAKKKRLKIYASDKTIGMVSFKESSWFTGYDAKFFYSKGAYTEATSPHLFFIKKMYMIFRTVRLSDLRFTEKNRWFNSGREGYRKSKDFDGGK